MQGEIDSQGWRAKVFLYCVEARCPQTGWMVPLLPTRLVSKGYKVIAELVLDAKRKRYDIAIRSGVRDAELKAAEQGTVRSDGRGQDPYLILTCELNGVNPFDYITALQKHDTELARHPAAWMPWNYPAGQKP